MSTQNLGFFILLFSYIFFTTIEATIYSNLQYNELLVSADSQTSPTKVSFIAKNNKVGIGTTDPYARLTVSSTGAAFTLAAMSKAFQTVSASLGSTVGSEVVLSSLGFSSSNYISLGIRGIRTTAGSDWISAALGIGMDVDNTKRAGASLYLSHSTQYVGIGTSVPAYKLEVVGTMKSSQWNVTQVMANKPGPTTSTTGSSIISTGNFTTYGGTLEILASGGGYSSSSTLLVVTVYITDSSGNNLYTLGDLTTYINETNSHRSLLPRTFVKTGVPAGTYMIKFVADSTTVIDSGDYYSCTVNEWPF